jgi:phytoene dehydrogenase-like protein
VIGAGHNGLVCGAYLARAGLRVLVLERREEAGGAAALAGTVGRLRRSVIRDLRLETHGLEMLRPEVRVFAPQPDGGAVTLWADPGRTAEELAPGSRPDAAAYPAFDRKVGALGSFMAHLAVATPPDLSRPSLADAFTALRLGRALRGLGSPRAIREMARVLPMSVADLVEEELEWDPLRAVVASRGVRYTAMGPRSAGTAAVLLMDSAGTGGGAAGEATFARGGPGGLAQALVTAARSFGAEVRCGAEVAAITTGAGRTTGVALASGEEVRAPVVVSGLDPKRTLLGLLDPVELGPTLVWRAGNLRMPGAVAHVDLEVDRLPSFPAARGEERRLAGRIVIAPGIDHLERASDAPKYGQVSEAPYLDATIPTLVDPTLAPEGRHLVRVLVQYAPYHLRDGAWADRAEGLGDVVLATLETCAPGITGTVVGRRVTTPADLEREFGLTEGHPLHGEPGLDQFFAWRPLLGQARYRLAVPGLYLCGSGAHPGGGVTGGPGANAAREILADRRRARR